MTGARLRLAAGLLLFLVGAASLACAFWLRSTLTSLRIDSARFTLRQEGLLPAVDCTLRGVNPLPLTITIRQLRVRLGARRLPAAVELAVGRPIPVPSGRFEVRVPVFGEGAQATVSSGAGLTPAILLGFDYEGSLVAGWGPFQRTLRFSGAAAPLL